MSRPEVTGRKVTDVPRAAYSIREFCVAHGISEPFYFRLKKLGLQPRETYVGRRVIISVEAAAEWRQPNSVHDQRINQQEIAAA
jgi:hypothetical protein